MSEYNKPKKMVFIDENGEFLFIGYSEKEIELAMQDKESFKLWLDINREK